jgi:hypothetical protein
VIFSFFHDIPSGSGKNAAARQILSIRSDYYKRQDYTEFIEVSKVTEYCMCKVWQELWFQSHLPLVLAAG